LTHKKSDQIDICLQKWGSKSYINLNLKSLTVTSDLH